MGAGVIREGAYFIFTQKGEGHMREGAYLRVGGK